MSQTLAQKFESSKIKRILNFSPSVPRTAAKTLMSLLTFCLGVVNTMQMDQLFQRRGLHTSLGKKVKEVILTVALSFVPLVVLVVYVVSLIGISAIAVFSWSWTEETAQPHVI